MTEPLPTSTVTGIEMPYTRMIDQSGNPVGPLPAFAKCRETLQQLYRAMVFTRVFDEKAIALQRTGRLGTYASSLGQEAAGVGVASAMKKDDVLLPSFREQSAMLLRGVTPAELLQYWGGDERGSDFKGPRGDFPVCIPVGTQFPHAAGVALAFKMRSEPRVAIAIGGDGSTSKGDFYEALNIAGVWSLPVVFVIINNQWAISVPRHAQTAAATLAHKATAAGIRGEQVDGNDVIAVREVVQRAIDKARNGGGSTLIEALTYRLSDHTTADDARRYRADAEVSLRWKDEPVARLRAHMVSHYSWTKELELELMEGCRAEVDSAVQDYLSMQPVAPIDMFSCLYAEFPSALEDQRAPLAGGSVNSHG